MDSLVQGTNGAGSRPRANGRGSKSAGAFRTISEVADELDVAQHVLRFWESKFPQVRPLKRGGGRRNYRPEDVDLLRRIRSLLYEEGYTIKGAQKLLKGQRRPTTGRRSTDSDRSATEDVQQAGQEDTSSEAQAADDADHPALELTLKHSLCTVRKDLVELRDLLRKLTP